MVLHGETAESLFAHELYDLLGLILGLLNFFQKDSVYLSFFNGALFYKLDSYISARLFTCNFSHKESAVSKAWIRLLVCG